MESLTNPEYTTKLSFVGVFYDFQLHITRNVRVCYFPYDKTVQLFDTANNRLILRRIRCDGLRPDDMFVRNTVTIYGKQIHIKDYANSFTRALVSNAKQLVLVLIKPAAVPRMGEIVFDLVNLGHQIIRMKMCVMERKQVQDFYKKRTGDPWLPFIVENMITGPIIAMELYGENAVERLKRAAGNIDPEIARKENPHSLRSKYGIARATNAFHISASTEAAEEEAGYFFPELLVPDSPTAIFQLKNCTCCVIKPHIVITNALGKILTSITSHGLFKITGLVMKHLYTHEAEEFFKAYKNIVSDYKALVSSILDGPCLVLEVSGVNDGVNVQQEFRKFAGPMDSHVARLIRPDTLRALYGIDKYRNALHCTDLPGDTALEVGYFFRVLD